MTDSERPPFSADTVLFVGNGVMRVPTHYVSELTSQGHGIEVDAKPKVSWVEYTEALWRALHGLRDRADGFLSLRDFERLDPPRQAEWFDDAAVRYLLGDQVSDESNEAMARIVASVRLDVLGQQLYSEKGVPTNDILFEISALLLTQWAAGGNDLRPIDLVTTNVDLGIEQSLALSIERALDQDLPLGLRAGLRDFRIEVVTRCEPSGVWCRSRSAGDRPADVRIWKLHGCLHAVRRFLEADINDIDEVARARQRLGLPAESTLFGESLPTNRLLSGVEGVPGSWEYVHPSSPATVTPIVFAQREYVALLKELLTNTEKEAVRELQRIFETRPVGFVGYSLHDVDVDVIAALHAFPSERRWTLRFGDRRGHAAEQERLRQLGIRWWSFDLPPTAFIPMPGRMRETAAHEWRSADLNDPWRRSLRREASEAWRRPQAEGLRRLGLELLASTPMEEVLTSIRAQAVRSRVDAPSPKIVVSGLASIWHAISLRKSDDFPTRRRVSATLSSIDQQVPGGSGLVPAMVAAVAAGPSGVGRVAFLSNVPESWRGWPEIREFCLSAGIDVRPRAQGDALEPAVGRTSHVLLFDTEQLDRTSFKPRQRLILDVESAEVERERAESMVGVGVGKVLPDPGIRDKHGVEFGDHDDFLFADKLTDDSLLQGWSGPIVFETGSSGQEVLDLSVGPPIWTASLGSYLRTLYKRVFNEDSIVAPHEADGQGRVKLATKEDWSAQLQRLRNSQLRIFVSDPEADVGHYFVRVNGFGSKFWSRHKDDVAVAGFSHGEEMAYGRWAQKNWAELMPDALRILGVDSVTGSGDPVLTRHERLGRGIVVTLHEAGLMAYWEEGGVWRPVVIKLSIDEQDEHRVVLRTSVESSNDRVANTAMQGVRIVVEPTVVEVTCAGACSERLKASRHRRNTLGAGDTVRGALAYGLWATAYAAEADVARPASIEHVLHASVVLATLKCYTGSFVDALRMVDAMRSRPTSRAEPSLWSALWGFTDPHH